MTTTRPAADDQAAPGERSPRRIVVGFDGSPTARAALAHAGRIAGRDGRLTVVYVSVAPPEWQALAYGRWRGPSDGDSEATLEQDQRRGRELLDSLPLPPDGPAVETEVATGTPARTLLEIAEARDADEIVVGSRGPGPLRLSLGRVSHALLHEANRPVVVVPARMLDETPVRLGGTVVVGYDGSPAARDAVAHAAFRAGGVGPLVLVYAFKIPFERAPAPFLPRAVADRRRQAMGVLEEIGPDSVGGLPVVHEVVPGPPAGALVGVAQSHRADEIVVGSRGLGPWRAALGSVSHALLYEADRPVVVVPDTPTPEEIEEAQRVRLAARVPRFPLRM